MSDEIPPLSSSALLAELIEKLDHVASASAMGAAQMTRAVRILDGNRALSARDRMALVDAYEKVHKAAMRLEATAERLAPRPPSLTTVESITPKTDEDTGVFFVYRGERRKIPTKVLIPLALIIGALVHWFGSKFPDILKWMTS